MQLFRGDKIFNKYTEPGRYRISGLRSKSFNGNCNPDNIEKTGLIESIRMHIDARNEKDKNYYDVTDYISFSESRERAMFWCSDMDSLKLEKSKEYEETRYLFTLDIDEKKLKNFNDGIYLFYYSCNPQLVSSDSGNEPHKSIFENNSQNQICSICNNSQLTHRLILINAFEYLNKNTNHARYAGAIESACKDREWLVLPFDPLGKYRSSLISRADFWRVEHFKAMGEFRPELGYV